MKKLTRQEAQAQARRLQSNVMLAPQSDEGRREIVDCLMRHCADAEHASRAMTHLLDNCQDPRSLTAALAAAADLTANTHECVPEGCAECTLTPDRWTGAKRYMSHVPGERNGYSCAVRCSCERGQWLARRDRERRETEAPERNAGFCQLAENWQRKAAGDSEVSQ